MSRSSVSFIKMALAILILLALIVPPLDAHAQTTGGFSGPGPDLVTVSQARKLGDDARVTLKGQLVKSLGDEVYLFKDSTGTIEVEIDNDIWRGQTINPEDTVIISGEMDKDFGHISVDVSTISKQ